jgi:hypothetical protein
LFKSWTCLWCGNNFLFFGAGLDLSTLPILIQLPMVCEFIAVVPAVVLSVFAYIGILCLLVLQHKRYMKKSLCNLKSYLLSGDKPNAYNYTKEYYQQ